MVADVSEYYLKLGAVVENGFSPTERNKGEDAKFLQQHIFPIVSPMQLVPAGNLIGKLPLRDEVVSALTFSYSDALSRLRATDRELGYLERDGSLRKTIEALVDRNSNQSGETLALLRAYRAFLTASAAGEACADHGADRKRIADLFNGMLVKHGEGHIKPLTVEELKFQSISDAERIDFIPNASEISGGLTKRLVAFRAAEEHAEQGVNPLSRSDWDADANDLLARADAFDASKGPCQVCLFQEKAELLFALFDLSPPDSTKERVLDHLAAFMADDPSQQDHPLEWLYRLKLLLNLARRASPDQVKQIEDLNKRIPRKVLIFLPSTLQKHIWMAVGNQNNPLMQEYVVAERLLENQYIMPPYR